MIQYIRVDKIYPHPDNPRKDLGDLTELADSIVTNGVLQNLTVVPWYAVNNRREQTTDHESMADSYTAVIGHRRLAAAKLAGLEEVPCIISGMSPKEQVATMLLENMQRNDLTIYEQAQGFQMLLDFGETMNGIAEQTGFSERTVRRRVKLLDLDQDKFKASVERGATLMDFAELDKIKKPELKNKVLESIGTRNFEYELRRAIDQEEMEAFKVIWIEALNKFATEIKTTSSTYLQGMRSIAWHSLRSDVTELKVPEDAGTTEYFYTITQYGGVTVYAKIITDQQTKQEDEQKYQEMDARKAELDVITERAYELRRDFIKAYKGKKKMFPALLEFWLRAMVDMCGVLDMELFVELMEFSLDEETDLCDLHFEDIADKVKASPERAFLVAAYCCSGDDSHNGYFQKRWQQWPSYFKNEGLDQLYGALEGLGYQISDEERALMTGEHELFKAESAVDI